MMALKCRVVNGDSEDVGKLVDPRAVYAAAAVLFDATAGVQIQGLPSAKWITCAGDDLDACVEAAESVARGNRGVYWTLHPCAADLAAPMASKYALRRRWLLIDLDPRREPDTNSTDAEHEAAQAVASDIQRDLLELGWPQPVIVDSGNGWHLLYRVDLESTPAVQTLLRKAIYALADKYDNEQVEVDRKTHDGRRISKLPGTLTRRGPATADRPHRWARLVFVPETLEVVTEEQLELLAGGSEPVAVATKPHVSGLVLKAKSGVDRRRAYAQAALEREQAAVILAPARQGNETLYKAAFKMGTLIGAGAILQQEAESALLHAATFNGRRSESESRATISSGLEGGKEKPRDLAFLDDAPTVAATVNGTHKPTAPARGIPKATVYTMTDLMAMELPPARWVIPGLMSEGLSLLAGKPKLGKSWLALNIALTVAVGGQALGNLQTVAGDVLYLALEDRLRRIQDRARKLLRGLQVPASGRLSIAVEWLRQDRGGLIQLAEWLEAADNPRLVIIDVWAKFRTASTGKRNAYDEDYEAVSEVKRLVDGYGTNLLALHHCKKGKADDVMEEISGTLGLSGCADGSMVLTRARSENEATLHVTGRDVDEQQLALVFDPVTCCWTNQGDAKLRTESRVRQKIMGIFRGQPGGKFFPKSMADLVNMDPDVVRKEMWRMAEQGILQKVNNAYVWPVDPVTEGDVLSV